MHIITGAASFPLTDLTGLCSKRKVNIEVLRNVKLLYKNVWEREVHLVCDGKVFCKAWSTIRISSPKALKVDISYLRILITIAST